MSVEFSGRKSIITPEGVFIIGTYDENGVPNAMNAAWGMQSDEGEITLMKSSRCVTAMAFRLYPSPILSVR